MSIEKYGKIKELIRNLTPEDMIRLKALATENSIEKIKSKLSEEDLLEISGGKISTKMTASVLAALLGVSSVTALVNHYFKQPTAQTEEPSITSNLEPSKPSAGMPKNANIFNREIPKLKKIKPTTTKSPFTTTPRKAAPKPFSPIVSTKSSDTPLNSPTNLVIRPMLINPTPQATLQPTATRATPQAISNVVPKSSPLPSQPAQSKSIKENVEGKNELNNLLNRLTSHTKKLAEQNAQRTTSEKPDPPLTLQDYLNKLKSQTTTSKQTPQGVTQAPTQPTTKLNTNNQPPAPPTPDPIITAPEQPGQETPQPTVQPAAEQNTNNQQVAPVTPEQTPQVAPAQPAQETPTPDPTAPEQPAQETSPPTPEQPAQETPTPDPTALEQPTQETSPPTQGVDTQPANQNTSTPGKSNTNSHPAIRPADNQTGQETPQPTVQPAAEQNTDNQQVAPVTPEQTPQVAPAQPAQETPTPDPTAPEQPAQETSPPTQGVDTQPANQNTSTPKTPQNQNSGSNTRFYYNQKPTQSATDQTTPGAAQSQRRVLESPYSSRFFHRAPSAPAQKTAQDTTNNVTTEPTAPAQPVIDQPEKVTAALGNLQTSIDNLNSLLLNQRTTPPTTF